jgi:mono/diheme cytochrome c family protein
VVRSVLTGASLGVRFAGVFFMSVIGSASAETQIERGEYLSHVMVCAECHTPGVLSGGERGPELGGSEVGYAIPFSGVYYGPNLTPDMETGLGSWSEDEIVTAIRTGVRPDGRILSPVMPWRAFAKMTDDDAYATAAYIKSLEPFSNKVPGPFGPTETPTSFYYDFIIPKAETQKTE